MLNLEKILKEIEKYLLFVNIFLFPLVVLPIFPDPFNTAKLVVFFGFLSLTIFVKFLSTVVTGKLEFANSKLDLGVIIFSVSYLLSGILRTPNSMDAFFNPGVASFTVGAGILYFLVNSLKAEDKKRLTEIYIYSSVLLGILYLFATVGLLKAIPQLPGFMKDPSFNTVGGVFPLIAILLTSTVLGANLFLNSKNLNLKILFGGCLATLIVSIGIAFIALLSLQKDSIKFLSFNASWAIATESVKASPLLGIGPGNYMAAFDKFRPNEYNSSPTWNLKYISGRNFFLTVLSEAGLLGIAGVLIILYGLWGVTKANGLFDRKNIELIPVFLMLVYFLIFPGSSVLIVIFMFLLSVSAVSNQVEVNLSSSSHAGWSLASRVPSLIVALPIICGVVFFWVKSTNVVLAETEYQNSLEAISRNDGKKAYDLLIKTISLNPARDVYHSTFAQINFALANSLAQKKDLTDKDKGDISTLIQQSINSGKNSVVLGPQKSQNWELLGSIYRAIMPLTKGSDKFAIEAYTRAVILDPINPNLRINLGGIYYSLKDYDNAIDIFKMAVAVKPDLANSHYNLAVAYKDKNMLDQAITEMTNTLSLLDKKSKDYETVKNELTALEAKRPAKQAQGGEEISAPQKASTPLINPKLDLPPDAAPPSVPVEPSQTPSGSSN